jgi:hypothetical protein
MDRRFLCTGFSAVLAMTAVAADQAVAQSKKAKKADLNTTELQVRRSVFSGNELQALKLWWVNADCSPGELPDARVVRAASNGEVSFQEVRTAVDLPKGTARSHCNGKPVNALAMVYKSRDDFVGEDNIVIDVDFKLGLLRRYSVKVDVR